MTIAIDMFAEPSAGVRKAITTAANRYAAFLGLSPEVTIRAQMRKRRKGTRKARDQDKDEDLA